jgi:hypothetical protein
VVFLITSGAFFKVYLENRQLWWAFIPAFTLLGMGLSSLVELIFPRLSSDFGGALFLLGISLGFVFVYLVFRANWWAVIPAGVLATLAVVSVLDAGNYGIDSGAVFFLGIGLTFGVLAILPGYESMLRWAYIPAGILLLIGLLISATSSGVVNLIIPGLLILIGFFVVLRTVVRKDT